MILKKFGLEGTKVDPALPRPMNHKHMSPAKHPASMIWIPLRRAWC